MKNNFKQAMIRIETHSNRPLLRLISKQIMTIISQHNSHPHLSETP